MSTLEERAAKLYNALGKTDKARVIQARLRLGDPVLIRYWRICTLWSDALGRVAPHPVLKKADMHWFPKEGELSSNNGWTACGGNMMGSTSWERACSTGVLVASTEVHVCPECASQHHVREVFDVLGKYDQ